MGFMAYVSLFYFLLTEIAMKGVNQNLQFTPHYRERGSISSVHGRTLPKYELPRMLTKFFLYTRQNVKTSRTLDIFNSQSLLDFDPYLDTKIIIHGFLDSVSIASWMHDMKDELLIYDHYNVIIVDWSSGNSIPYSRAAVNTKKVGQEISELLTRLINEYGAEAETFHIIGHSLGSHIAGFVGENIKGIGRITGLDPAAPHFEDKDPNDRLDPSDAVFVDVIHTDSGGIGMVEATGHQDFYPNGGREQPGCTASNSLRALLHEGVIEGARNVICSHMRAPYFFTSSINNRNCQMTGVLCNSWQEFIDGKCIGCGESGETCAVMGFHADPLRTGQNRYLTYFLLTTEEEPYCAYEYKVTFEVEGTQNSRGGLLGLRLNDLPVIGDKTLHLSVFGRQGRSEFILKDKRFGSTSRHVTYMVPSNMYLGIIDGVVVEWRPFVESSRVLSVVTGQSLTTPRIRKIEITPVNDASEMGNHPENYVLCSRETSSGLNRRVTFRSDYC